MDKYLLEILKDVNTIIIPNLGALTITDKEKGEIMFMDYLKHDDGKLSAYIAEKEGMEEIEAKNLIAKYVREIYAKLDQGESYDMFEFGSFIKVGDDIDFKNWEGGAVTEAPKDTPKEEPKEAPKKAEKKPAAKKTEEKEVKKPAAKKPAKKEAPKKAAPKEENTKAKTTLVIPISEATEEKTSSRKMNIAEKEELAKTVGKLDKLKEKKKETKKEKKKRGVGFWILIVLIALLVGGGTVVGIYYEDVKQHIPFLADAPVEKEHNELEEMEEILGISEDESAEETIAEDGAVEEEIIDEAPEEIVQEAPEEIVEEAPEKIETPVNSSAGAFHLIAGAFSEEENASRMVDQLKSQGYPAKILVGSGLHMVSIKSYTSQSAAEADRGNVSSVAPKAWVLEWR